MIWPFDATSSSVGPYGQRLPRRHAQESLDWTELVICRVPINPRICCVRVRVECGARHHQAELCNWDLACINFHLHNAGTGFTHTDVFSVPPFLATIFSLATLLDYMVLDTQAFDLCTHQRKFPPNHQITSGTVSPTIGRAHRSYYRFFR